jgi:hypothetical protein
LMMQHLALLLLVLGAAGAAAEESAGHGPWKEYKGMGYTCSGEEFRGTVPDHNNTAAGCSAAAQKMVGCHAGVNYATCQLRAGLRRPPQCIGPLSPDPVDIVCR